jgi:hypothetical protein
MSGGCRRASRTTWRALGASLMIGGETIMSSVSSMTSLPSGCWVQLFMSACSATSLAPSLTIVSATARSFGFM